MKVKEMKLSDLKISEPAKRALRVIGVNNLEDCVLYTKEELLELHGFGPKSIRIIEEELSKIKKSLKNKL